MPSPKGKVITGYLARLTFLKRDALARGERVKVEQRFIMYLFRDAASLTKTVQPAMDEVRGTEVACELDVYRASVTVGEKVGKDRVRPEDAPILAAVRVLNGGA